MTTSYKHKAPWDPEVTCGHEMGGKTACRAGGQPGSGSRLGNFGKQDAARTYMFEQRRASKTAHYTARRTNLGKASIRPSKQVGYPVQAHHMIAKSIYNLKKFKDFAVACGYDIDNSRNCILLPKYCGFQMWDSLQFHKSGHWDNYFEEVTNGLNKVIKGFTKADFCKLNRMKTLHQRFHKFEDELFADLNEGMKLKLYADTKKFYGKDYKDEWKTSFDQARAWIAAGCPRKKYTYYFNYSKTSPRCPYPKVNVPASAEI